MSPFEHADEVGVVGSPSTTSEIVLDLVGKAARQSLVGSMVLLEQEMEDGRTECALGTVTEITTRNQWHENTAMRGVIAGHGKILALSGRADVKGADVAVQAVYAHVADAAYKPSGSTLSMSPTTGARVIRVTDAILHELTTAASDNVFYLGDIYRMPGVRMPLNPSDFSGGRGAFHAGVFGPSGVGKSVFTTYYIAGQLRHRDLGVLVVDPQGQFSGERGFTFSLQRLAGMLQREVICRSLSTEIRLPQDKGLLCELMGKTPFFRGGLNMRHGPAVEAASMIMEEALERMTGWSDNPIQDTLTGVLTALHQAQMNNEIYKDLKTDKSGAIQPGSAAAKLLDAINQALTRSDGGNRWDRLMRYFHPVAALFAPTGPSGETRMKMSRLLHLAFERSPGTPRRVVILNMAFAAPPGADQETVAMIKQLNAESTKARILRKLFDELERVAAEDYQTGDRLLNTMIVFDEAWRYAPRSAGDPEVKALAEQLAGYARETRKYGVGWMYVLQSPHTLHPDVWDQLKSGFRALGYGLTGVDLELVRAQVDRPESISLYRSFTQPSEQNRQYPFMVVGSISPLSFTMAPLYVTIYPTFKEWVSANADWLPPNAADVELDPTTGRSIHAADPTAGGNTASRAWAGDGEVPPPDDPFM